VTLILSNTGGYPRSGETPELQVLETTRAAMERGERTSADLADAENEMTRRAIEDQARAGIELFTDGLIRGHDPISYLAGKLENVVTGSEQPLLKTGLTFRQPILRAAPKRVAALLVEEFQFARNALGQIPTDSQRAGRIAIKAVIVGPYTLAKLSQSDVAELSSIEKRAEIFSSLLAEEIGALFAAGAEYVQVDEPAILSSPADWEIFEGSLEKLCAARKKAAAAQRPPQLVLSLTQGDASALYEKLAQVPVDVLGLDFACSPRLADTIASLGAPISLGLGLLNAAVSELEEPGAVARTIEKLLPKIKDERAYLGPSAGLENLPRSAALAKLQLLPKIRKAVLG
jgi:5-methyltetrahydropteroyltriglutamate--homocysteine methyltransferase